MTQEQNILYSWKYSDKKERSPIWYFLALAIALGLIIWGILTRQYGMSIVIMLTVGFFFFLENNTEDMVQADITEQGIRVMGNFYDYSRVRSFSLVYHGDQAVYLRIIVQKKGISALNLRIDNSNANDIRSLLLNYVEEKPRQEITFLEKLTHLLKL